MNKEIDLLAFGAHPDDVEICCGGLLALATEKNYSTAIVDLTRGELGSRGSVETRQSEAEAASRELGLSMRENLGMPDGRLNPYQNGTDGATNNQLEQVVKAIRRIRPEFILAPYHQGRHPDHIATSELVTQAVFYSGLKNYPLDEDLEPHTIKQTLYYQMRYTFEPSFLVDISAVQKKKMAAVLCYESQVGKKVKKEEIAQIKDESVSVLVNSPLTLSSIEARDRYYGAMIGRPYAEAYFTRGSLRVDDPLAFFRNNPTENSLFFPNLK